MNNYPYCGVCGKKVNVDNERFVEHKNKRGRLCYGSFTPAHDINPFRKRRGASLKSSLQEPDWDVVADMIEQEYEQVPIPEPIAVAGFQQIPDIPPEVPQENYIQEEVLDDNDFLNALRNPQF